MNHNNILREHKKLTFAERNRLTTWAVTRRPKRSPRSVPNLTGALLDYEDGALSHPAERRLMRQLRRAKLIISGQSFTTRI